MYAFKGANLTTTPEKLVVIALHPTTYRFLAVSY